MKQKKSVFEIMAEIWKEVIAEDVLVWLDEKYDEWGRRRREVDINEKGRNGRHPLRTIGKAIEKIRKKEVKKMERKEALEVMVNSVDVQAGKVCEEIMNLENRLARFIRTLNNTDYKSQLWELKNRLQAAADIGRTMILECEAGEVVADSKPPPTPSPSEGMSPGNSK